ncbi:MAG: thymidine phosphorylase, partial [Erysipelotrichia bacterium]|nr:thymidine phosphorylase [Erysipelotrichia bacterium]
MAMIHSGDTVDLTDLPGIKLDKHSTGGVGDTTTLVVAPLVAACGGTVAKMSGRGLGHTGGTLDKLEAIPGTCIEQPIARFKEIVRECGLCVIGQTANLVPADKKMYALRDVTATVRSTALITSSIMSKKLAAGADAIILDVKTGTGAFMRTKEEAFKLAKLMVDIGALVHREVRAVVTDMNQPLGMAVGNALEVREAVELLSGELPETDSLYQVCMLLGTQMLLMGHLAEDETDARAKLQTAIRDGSGLKKLQTMVTGLGGDASYLTMNKIDQLLAVKQLIEFKTDRAGFIASMDGEMIGKAAQMLGAGRACKEDIIDPSVGLVMKVRCGAEVKAGDTLCTLYVNDDSHLNESMGLLKKAVHIRAEKGEVEPIVYGIVTESTRKH